MSGDMKACVIRYSLDKITYNQWLKSCQYRISFIYSGQSRSICKFLTVVAVAETLKEMFFLKVLLSVEKGMQIELYSFIVCNFNIYQSIDMNNVQNKKNWWKTIQAL